MSLRKELERKFKITCLGCNSTNVIVALDSDLSDPKLGGSGIFCISCQDCEYIFETYLIPHADEEE